MIPNHQVTTTFSNALLAFCIDLIASFNLSLSDSKKKECPLIEKSNVIVNKNIFIACSPNRFTFNIGSHNFKSGTPYY